MFKRRWMTHYFEQSYPIRSGVRRPQAKPWKRCVYYSMNLSLSKKQFDILVELTLPQKKLSQRSIAERCGYSLGTVNNVLKSLADSGYIADGAITEAGLEALEPYRVRRAVFLAAGFGSRMVPITLNTPKPLVRVHGQRLIDGLINACLAIGIEEICIVRGYLGEQFDQLLYKYPMIRFIDNPLYNEANNISSALCVRELLQNAYVMEADLYLTNPQIIRKYHYQSNFLAFRKNRTDDWCFEVSDGIITKEKVGGLDCWQMVGISYWDTADGDHLARDIKAAYEQPGGKEYYWEQVPLVVFKNRYKVAVNPCSEEDITEIDTFNELKQIDPSYDD